MGNNVYGQYSYLLQKFAGTFKTSSIILFFGFKHVLVLLKYKMKIGKKDIEFLGYKISKG